MTDPDKTRETALRLLSRFAEAHGAPGYEDGVRRVFRDELSGEITSDRFGSVICKKAGKTENPRIMLTAHMDEVGFVAQSITKSGLIKFLPLGGWWPHTLPAKRVRVLTQKGVEIIGVIGAKPPHFLSEAEREKVMKIEDMFIDVGAADADDLRERFDIRPGDSIVPESSFTPMHNPDLLLCKAFDNRAGMSVIVQAAGMLNDLPHPNTVYTVGTVQEEVGVRGAQTAAAAIEPDAAIVIEGTPADDLPGVSEDERQGALGRGVQIRLMDPSAIMNRKFAQYAVRTAEEHMIPYQTAVRKSGGTDARAIQLTGSGVPTIVLGVPARYIHTHNGIIRMQDYLAVLELSLTLIQSLDEARVKSFTDFSD